MSTHGQPRLTASELATLWNTYIADTMGKCMLLHFKNTVEDKKYTNLHSRSLARRSAIFVFTVNEL
ncbi:DUF3231 family protein [Neobacillus sp. NRS-1170]|uniref:DUF3231 family protein n=1 Tax=Neobacillus sp. NRS-1170 TaxID=3233898 RepID=UPI003D2E0EB0